MSVRPYQFKPLKKCSGHVEDCGDKGETSNTGEYNECNLENQLLLADRMNLNSVKEWCTCGYCSMMPTNREYLCSREIDDIVSKKLSDGILIYVIHSHMTCSLIFSFVFKSDTKISFFQ